MKTLGLSKTAFAFGVVLVLTLWAIVFHILFTDDELSAETEKLLSKQLTKSGEEAYYFLMGFNVAEEDDPIEEGKILAARIKAENEKYLNGKTDTTTPNYPANKAITIPDAPVFCKHWEDDCYKKIFQDAPSFDETHPNYILITQRFSKFLSFNEYQTPTQNTTIEPKPAYKLTTNANRLILIRNIKLAAQGDIEAANLSILEHIKRLRISLSTTDDLIGKMVFLNELAESLDVLSILNNKYHNNKEIYVSELTANELSLEDPLKSEFRGIYGIYENLNNTKNSELTYYGLPGMFIRLIFKPNMTINYSADDIKDLINRSKLPPYAITKKIDTPEWSLLNIAGNRLYLLSSTTYDKYLPRVQSINIKIALLNHAFKNKNLQKNAMELINPYYGTMQKVEKFSDRICLKGPVEDTRNFHCLQISY